MYGRNAGVRKIDILAFIITAPFIDFSYQMLLEL